MLKTGFFFFSDDDFSISDTISSWREDPRDAYASLIVTHGEGTRFFVDLRSSPPARYIKQASNNRISSREYYGRNF